MTAPRRHWLSFSLRTLFVAMTVVGCWLGYQVHWIQQRRSGRDWIDSHRTWGTVVIVTGEPPRGVPWSLAILGEKPIDKTALLAPQSNEDYNPTEYRQRFAEIERLFPERSFADFGDEWPEPE